jgi:broad specificity phosphatase PhoE
LIPVNNESIEKWDEIVIITHGAVIREFLEQALKLGEGSSWKFKIGNGSVLKLDLCEGNFCVYELIANPHQ